MTIPFGWGMSNPPPKRQFKGISAPVTMLHQRWRSTATARGAARQAARFLEYRW
jgi:hypothetical protein